MTKRSKPYFSDETISAILDAFRTSMDAAKLYYDPNLLDAVEAYAKSPKHIYENNLLRNVAEGKYRFTYRNGEATFGTILPPKLAEYKAKYPIPLEQLKQNPDLYRQAMLDSVEWGIKGHLEEFKARESNLSHAMDVIARGGSADAGKISKFLKAPFEERSLDQDLLKFALETHAPALNVEQLNAAAAHGVSPVAE